MRIALAVIHLLALGIGLGAIYARARSLRRFALDALPRVFAADTWWGIAALLWISTGLWRVLAGTEKMTSYYWNNWIFYVKMGLLLLVLLLELSPMLTLIRWRLAASRGGLPSVDHMSARASRLAMISQFQLVLVIGMVVAATLMARGFGARP